MSSRYEVVIVGGGPVGVGLAVELGERGISCAVVEKRDTLSSIPKGQGLSQRTLEHFARWGIADELRAVRVMPRDLPIGQVTIYESLVSEHWQAKPSREVVKDYYAEPNERLPQYKTEEVLRRKMSSLPSVDHYFGHAATSIEQDADEARVTVERDGDTQTLTGSYVVGCDGGHSLVRDQANIDRSGTDWDELVTLIVFRSRELHELLVDRFPLRSTYRVMHPALNGYWMFFGRVDGDEEFFFHAPVPPGEGPGDFDAEAALHRAAGVNFSCEIDHVGYWDLRVQVANTYRAGRVFIAGDAAHTHPPYGGFGLNNGLEDAVNLGWKLAARLRGWGGESLLDSYSLERRAIFRDVGEEIIGGWINDDRAFFEAHHPDRDRAAFEVAFADMAAGFGKRLGRFEPHYEGSPVVLGPPNGVSSALGQHTFTARAGHHLPPRPLTSGRSTFEELGEGFTLIALDVPEGQVDAFTTAATLERIPLTTIRDSFDAERCDYDAQLILVRPDQYVVWVGNEPPADIRTLLTTVTGQP